MKAIEASDPYEKRLKPIQQDVNIKMGPNRAQSPWVVRLEGDPTEYANESGALVCHGVVVIRSLIWPGAFTLFQNGKQTAIYVGNAMKFSGKEQLRPYPLSPPILNEDPTEYGEFILPDIKELTPEEITAKIEESYDELWGKYEGDAIGADEAKSLARDIKGKVTGVEEPPEINEEAFEEAFNEAQKNDEGNIEKDACRAMIISIYDKL